jgi:hypothetical protein
MNAVKLATLTSVLAVARRRTRGKAETEVVETKP